MRTPRDPIYAGHRYPAEIISYAVWLYFRFPLSLRMVEEMLAARGISVTHETIRQWGLKFGREFANRIRRRLAVATNGTLDEVVISVSWKKPSLVAPSRIAKGGALSPSPLTSTACRARYCQCLPSGS